MESTNIRQIKAALWDQAFIGNTWVSCPMGLWLLLEEERDNFWR
jgi:hypothetical protein